MSLLCLLLLFVAYPVFRLVLFYFRLSAACTLDLEQINRGALGDSDRRWGLAREVVLEPFLVRFAARSDEDFRQLDKWAGKRVERGHDADETAETELQRAVSRLLAPDRYVADDDWGDEFIRQVHGPLVDIAERRIKHCAALVTVKTAVSPWRFVDVAVVVYNSTCLVRDLFFVFNQRMGWLNTVRVTIQLMVNMYVSGETQALLEQVSEAADHVDLDGMGQSDMLDGVARVLRESTGLPFVGAILKRTAEGGITYLLMRRLGRLAAECVMVVR